MKKNKKEITTGKDLLRYFLDNFSDLKFNDVNNDSDEDNGKNLKDLFKLEERFENNELIITSINGKYDVFFSVSKEDKDKILKDIFDNKKLELELITYYEIEINTDFRYKLKKEFQEKLKKVNNEIKTFFNVGQIKNLMQEKGFERSKISIKNETGEEIDDNLFILDYKIRVNYIDNTDIYDDFKPKTAKIEFIAGNDLALDKNAKNCEIDFVKDSITKDTTIFDFITNKFKGLSDKNCKIEYFNYEYKIWKDVKEGDGFEDEDKIRITINAEVKDYTIKKNTQNPPKTENKQNQDKNDTGSDNKKRGCYNKCSGGNKNK